jgi:hypothetical protein
MDNGNKSSEIAHAMNRIGKAVLTSINYQPLPVEELNKVTGIIDNIISSNSSIIDYEIYFKSRGKEDFLLFLSNIIYNLKAKNNLVLTPEILKWLGSVWKNFIKRNITYIEYMEEYNKCKENISKYYPEYSMIIKQIQNAHFVKQEYIDNAGPDYLELRKLEDFYRRSIDILNTMRPTYFFLLDYYYEIQLAQGKTLEEGTRLEQDGLAKFGKDGYSFEDISILTCQVLGVIEATYLMLKKKKTQKQLINIDGKQKFLTISEIYNIYLNKFNDMKKELMKLK